MKIHIAKNHNIDICGKGKVDAWVDEVNISEGGEEKLIDKNIGHGNCKGQKILRTNFVKGLEK